MPLLDRYFLVWAEKDAAKRADLVKETTTSGVVFRDAFGALEGQAQLEAHVAASQMHMPGISLVREGEPRVCQGTGIVSFTARGADGAVRGRGENVVDFAPDGRIARIVGLWGA